MQIKGIAQTQSLTRKAQSGLQVNFVEYHCCRQLYLVILPVTDSALSPCHCRRSVNVCDNPTEISPHLCYHPPSSEADSSMKAQFGRQTLGTCPNFA